VSADGPQPERRTVVRAILGVAGTAAGLAVGGCTTGAGSQPGSPRTTTVPLPATQGRAVPSGTPPTSPQPAPGPPLSQPGPDIVSGPSTPGRVALTFHGAGDPALTAKVLDVARSAGAHLTVFAVGQWLAANPSVGRDIVGAGHDLGNHTWSHQAMTHLTASQAGREVQDGARAVAAAVGSPGLLFRPSGTPTSTATIRAAALAAGYQRCVSYDVDPEDYLDPGAELVRSRTLAAAKGGSIVSLHLGHAGTVEALPGILAGLAARGLSAVRLTDLLSGA